MFVETGGLKPVGRRPLKVLRKVLGKVDRADCGSASKLRP
jgi:hypothetical protein